MINLKSSCRTRASRWTRRIANIRDAVADMPEAEVEEAHQGVTEGEDAVAMESPPWHRRFLLQYQWQLRSHRYRLRDSWSQPPTYRYLHEHDEGQH